MKESSRIVRPWHFSADGFTMSCDVERNGVTKSIYVKFADQVMLSAQELSELLERKLSEAFEGYDEPSA